MEAEKKKQAEQAKREAQERMWLKQQQKVMEMQNEDYERQVVMARLKEER